MKIYTKTGDKGHTSLLGGTRVKKDNFRIEAYGTVDETNAAIGLIVSHLKYGLSDVVEHLTQIQNKLFTLGSSLALSPESSLEIKKIEESDIIALESWIDNYTSQLPELKNFILPGGSEVAAFAHLARTVCRRAERRVITLASEETVDDIQIKYLNRLSDYLFVLSRYLNAQQGIQDVIWSA